MCLLQGEELIFSHLKELSTEKLAEEEINEKYAKGDVRIVTEQARYPLPQVADMVESDKYELNPEFQRRHRWDIVKQSRLIESFIMNVPIPPIFLYEHSYAKYEVMDGLQRLTAIHDYYRDQYALERLEEWPELNGCKYSELPEQIKAGIDRRYISSIILLQETAKSAEEAQALKQLVFERINSGGVKLEPQESRNAIYDGPLNRLCIRLSRNVYLCKTWGIPEPAKEEIESKGKILSPGLLKNTDYREMKDVELVLRFFSYRQRHKHSTSTLWTYYDNYLKYGNLMDKSVLDSLGTLFEQTISTVYEVFGEKAFWLWRKRDDNWNWRRAATVVVYDPMMYVISQHLDRVQDLKDKRTVFQESLTKFYERYYDDFEGRNVNPGALDKRQQHFERFIQDVIG